MDRYKLMCALLGGMVIGMACSEQIKDSIEDTSSAAPSAASACSAWEAKEVTTRTGDAKIPIPAGWEPFGLAYNSGNGDHLTAIRRCTDD